VASVAPLLAQMWLAPKKLDLLFCVAQTVDVAQVVSLSESLPQLLSPGEESFQFGMDEAAHQL
jgi:hypothetical protein